MDPIAKRLATEHAELRDMVAELYRGTCGDSDAALLGVFTVFSRALRAHLRFEAEVLFPQMDGPFAGQRTTSRSLRREQGPIRDLLRDIERGLSRPDRQGVLGNLKELASAISLHHAKAQESLGLSRTACVAFSDNACFFAGRKRTGP
jgi:hypothetical protein